MHQSTIATSLFGSGIQRSAIRLSHPNVLLVGSADANERALLELLPLCLTPMHEGVDQIDSAAAGGGTVVVRQLEQLDTARQIALCEWLGRRGRDLQIVSLASTYVFQLVLAGLFLDTLFYRLNVVTLHTD